MLRLAHDAGKICRNLSYGCAKATAAVLSGTGSSFLCALLLVSISLLGCELYEAGVMFLFIPVQNKLQWHYNPLCFGNINK